MTKTKYIYSIDEKQYAKNRVLFAAAIVATIFQIGWLILEMLGYQKVLFEMTAVYLLILTTYAIHNRIIKWGINVYKIRRGELFVYFIWVFTFLIYTLYIFNLISKIPDQLSLTFSGVTTIFFGTEILKLVGKLIQAK